MSSRQRKRPGGAAGPGPAQKRSRLLPSSAGGTSQAQPIDLEEGGAPAFEPAAAEVIDLTGGEFIDVTEDYFQLEVITISDDESSVEQSQQQPHLSSTSESSAEPLARDDEEEAREDDGDSLLYELDVPFWSDEDSQDREQNQVHSHLSGSAENSVGPLTTRDKEERRDNDGARPAGPANAAVSEGDNSEVQDKEQNQQDSLGSRVAEASLELWLSDSEEESRDNDGSIDSNEWSDRFESPPTWHDDITEDWEEIQQYPAASSSEENSLELLLSILQQEPRDIEFEPPGDLVSPPNWENDNAELLEVNGQEGRNVTLNSDEQVGGSGGETGASDAPVAASAPEEQGAAEEEDSESSVAEPGVVIRCPICMDFYSQIVQSGRQLVATICGHVFCSRCLPIALETVPICPTCRMEITPELYINIYL